MRIARIGLVVTLAALAAGEAPAQKKQVDLGQSFRISYQGRETALSHVPALQFSADGKSLAAGTSTGEIFVWDRKTRKETKRFAYSKDPVRDAAVDPSGRWLVAVHASGTVAAIALETGKPVGSAQVSGATVLAIHPSAGLVALAAAGRVQFRALPDLADRGSRESGMGAIGALAWSPDGRTLALAGGAAPSQHKGQAIPQGQGALEVRSHPEWGLVHSARKPAALFAVAWHPRRPVVAYGGVEKRIWQADLQTRAESWLPGNQPYWITALGYSPTGEMIVAGDESCDVWLYQLPKQQDKPPELLLHAKHHVECWLSAVSWTPDGKRFLLGCRPNTHSRRPQVWNGNNDAEAQRCAEFVSCAKEIAARREALRKQMELADNRAAWQELAALKERIEKRLPQVGSRQLAQQQAAGNNWAGQNFNNLAQNDNQLGQQMGWNFVAREEDRRLHDSSLLGLLDLAPRGWTRRGLDDLASRDKELCAAWERMQALERQILASDSNRRLQQDAQALGQTQQRAYQQALKDLKDNYVINQYEVK